jgi:hypothetical protein
MREEKSNWRAWIHSHPLLVFFALVFLITWGIGAIALFVPAVGRAFASSSALTNPLFYAAVYAPTVSSLALTALLGGSAGLRQLLGRLLPWRAGLEWYLIVLAGYPLAGLLAGRAAGLFGAPQGSMPNWAHFYAALLPALVVDPGPLGEELGWRGFALPRMLERWSPLTASLILGLIWGTWHFPAFFIAGLPQKHMALPIFFLNTISLSVADTWLFLRAKGNLLPPILVHLITNHYSGLLHISFQVSVAGAALLAAAVVLLGGMRRPSARASATV